ncbi:hypothetical protein CD30_19105 [Ureibacillus massiliensis 4400831 = CIP 108448 = CCUG 49529]|uniref:Uncharacterized protein n=1 Tax=Ureibacillus massiliensis 4400831 = CIP 108448 = CCUG 49529 TaxID=1211035 RepID=A0A0A3JF83_9BACL|nr:hypothetical protein CD30_19105 [Ureibacillus massiliensis 4400831 = CIP 108448 = CCUG 49529]
MRTEYYSDSELKKILLEYSNKNTGVIKYLGLEKETGISRKTWKRRMEETINHLNRKVITSHNNVGSGEIPYPNFDLIIDRFSNDEKGLREALYHIQEVFIKNIEENNKLSDQVMKKDKRIDELTHEIEKLKRNLYEKKQEVNYYEKLMIESTNPSVRKRKGISSNLIEISEYKKESAASLDLEKEFPELFGDLDDDSEE